MGMKGPTFNIETVIVDEPAQIENDGRNVVVSVMCEDTAITIYIFPLWLHILSHI